MLRIDWDPLYETGNATVDEQHRSLVALFNDLVSAEQADGAPAVSAVLERLSDYVLVHFSAEESLMASSDYPTENADSHIVEHRHLTAQTRELVIAYRAGQIESIVPVAEFLHDWLTGHIRQCDRLLIEHVRAATS